MSKQSQSLTQLTHRLVLVSLYHFSAISSCAAAACAFNRLTGAAQGRHRDRLCRFASLVGVGVIGVGLDKALVGCRLRQTVPEKQDTALATEIDFLGFR